MCKGELPLGLLGNWNRLDYEQPRAVHPFKPAIFYGSADMSPCPFCFSESLRYGRLLARNSQTYLITTEDPILEYSAMVIPYRHVATPFEMTTEEWVALKDLLYWAKEYFDKAGAEGYNLGWNVGEVAGQSVAHVHFHVIARFSDEPLAGKGIRHVFKQTANRRPKDAHATAALPSGDVG